MEELSKKVCTPCQKGTLPLSKEEIEKRLPQLQGWVLNSEEELEKELRFPDFKKALSFVNALGELAEKEGHHPDIYLSYGKVRVTLWTHKIHGLSENDFILAAKCDKIPI